MNTASSNADTTSPVPSGLTSQHSPSQPGPSRQTQQIRFPSEPVSSSSKAPSSPSRSASGLISPESSSRADTSRAVLSSGHDADTFGRRRIRSTLAPDSLRPFGSYSRSQHLADSTRSRTSGRRTVSHSLHSSDRSNTRGASSIGSSPLFGGVLLPSEEINANQENDPNILADLHKALQYKSHVEQHLKEAKSFTEFPSSLPSMSGPNASPNLFTSKGVLPLSEPNTPIKAEFIDFSPSTGKSSLHPVPKSSDDGATLDWSGSAADDDKHEKKWTMPLPRRSSKDKNPPLSRKALVEKQDVKYSEKISRIKANLNEHTMRKAEITRDQLQRRYAAFDAAHMSSGSNLNLADVARWYNRQGKTIKSQIAESESMPWLRHLTSKRDPRQQECRSPWNLSAMIVDHYVKSHSDTEFFLSPISAGNENSDVTSSSPARCRQVSKPTSLGSIDAALARKSDEMISFEPMTHPRGDSLETESRVSVDTQLKRWRQSLLNRADHDMSSDSSISRKRNGSLEQRNTHAGRNSSASALSPLHNLGVTKLPHRTLAKSDDGQSSAADSVPEGLNEDQESESKVKKISSREKRRSRFPLSLDLGSAQRSQGDSNHSPAPISIADLRTDASQPNKSRNLPVRKERPVVGSVDTFDDAMSSNNHLGSPIVLSPVQKTHEKRAQKLSLPPAFQTRRPRGRSDTRTEAQRHALQVEYNRKQELLDALLARNQRMKSLLQLAARSMADYDETQSAISDKLGLGYSRLPPEVLETLKHDPSAIAGHLRNLKGWRAVEDIHNRRERQRQILQTFVASLPDTVAPLSLPKDGIYENAIANLRGLVERLHSQRNTVLSHVRQTQELLSKVKKMRDELKPEFDETSRHTSVNYPELVRLESLLDELVNGTNHLWRFAEASLSFLLASVAPVMKTFGRPVWDELHDFLVIPLYRNGFSGEEHWYPVSFPRRSFTQWLRLLLVAACAPALLYHGCRAFLALLTHGYVLRIPSFIPTFAVYIVFSSIMFAFGSVLSGLFIAVLCEMFIVFWWTLWLLHIVQ
ncbi:hypothetical protein A7U60_g5045 [Sanghuangporus baumii]|uniref:Uncharacterized protein n=1 Tax=Sanghuangporus baumii TaxID=108892 RepID=A0A9Q5HXM8_SANBA|nr:hypothetical protein A7U60_g5045 [Sanghuangporus baumii]